jgi:acetate kinase
MSEVSAVGHRVARRGSYFVSSVPLTSAVIDTIEQRAPTAPLHDPPTLLGIQAALDLLPDIRQVIVLDTASHSTLPAEAHMNTLPYECRDACGGRRHGTRHERTGLQG